MQINNVDAVIFDWAGTTIDYGCMAPVAAIQEAFAAVGIMPTPEEIREPMGQLKRDHIKAMLTMERIADAWQERYGRPWNEDDVDSIYRVMETKTLAILPTYTDLKPWVIPFIKNLREKSIRIGSTTGYTDEMMAIVVEGAEKKGYTPDFWITPNGVNNMGRPHPFMIYENMKVLGVDDKNRVLKVGDTVADIAEGKNAGVRTLGIIEGSSIMGLTKDEYDSLTEAQKRERRLAVRAVYQEAGADYIADHLGQVFVQTF